MKRLRKAARLYHRPMCLFFLPSLPDDADSIRDFRRISGAVDLGLTPARRFEIRLARKRREEALELARDLRQPPAGFAERASLDDDPEVLATRLRQRLGVSLADQTGWQSKYDGFNSWRAAIERLGALVFQTGATPSLRVEPNEARGFSIADKPFPVIVVNGSDPVTARSFTLLHELAHIVLRNGGVCDLHHTVSPRNEIDRVEVFCSRVAGAVLVPAEAARRFWVSCEVVLRRLLIVGKTTKDFYYSCLARSVSAQGLQLVSSSINSSSVALPARTASRGSRPVASTASIAAIGDRPRAATSQAAST